MSTISIFKNVGLNALFVLIETGISVLILRAILNLPTDIDYYDFETLNCR